MWLEKFLQQENHCTFSSHSNYYLPFYTEAKLLLSHHRTSNYHWKPASYIEVGVWLKCQVGSYSKFRSNRGKCAVKWLELRCVYFHWWFKLRDRRFHIWVKWVLFSLWAWPAKRQTMQLCKPIPLKKIFWYISPTFSAALIVPWPRQ